jgi:hypothetical protein
VHLITHLSLANFKAFRNEQSVPLRPITLVFGANSSGKSSLLHALLLLHHGIETGDWDTARTLLGGTSVDLGGYHNYGHRHEASEPVLIGASIAKGKALIVPADPVDHLSDEGEDPLNEYTGLGVEIELGHDAGSTWHPSQAPFPTRLRVTSDGHLFFDASVDGYAHDPYFRYRLEALNVRAPFLQKVMGDVHNTAPIDIGERSLHLTDLVADVEAMPGGRRLLDSTQRLLLDRPFLMYFDARLQRSGDERSALAQALAHLRHYSHSLTLERNSEGLDLSYLFEPAIDQASAYVQPVLQTALAHLEYLGPLRAYPERLLADPSGRSAPEAGGLHAWHTVLKNAEVREAINEWLGSDLLRTGYRFSERIQYALDDIRHAYDLMAGDPDRDFTAALELTQPASRDLVLTDLRSGTRVSHRDIGLGIAQVLPVLVAAFGSRERQVLIEQPELHLHPALQAELADVFIKSALGDSGNRFVLETHSEHLILRLLRRIRETSAGELPADDLTLHPEDISVLYVDSTKNGSRALELRVSEDGDFLDRWPDGFFPERATELF